MICPNCGHELKEKEVICRNCGARVVVEERRSVSDALHSAEEIISKEEKTEFKFEPPEDISWDVNEYHRGGKATEEVDFDWGTKGVFYQGLGRRDDRPKKPFSIENPWAKGNDEIVFSEDLAEEDQPATVAAQMNDPSAEAIAESAETENAEVKRAAAESAETENAEAKRAVAEKEETEALPEETRIPAAEKNIDNASYIIDNGVDKDDMEGRFLEPTEEMKAQVKKIDAFYRRNQENENNQLMLDREYKQFEAEKAGYEEVLPGSDAEMEMLAKAKAILAGEIPVSGDAPAAAGSVARAAAPSGALKSDESDKEDGFFERPEPRKTINKEWEKEPVREVVPDEPEENDSDQKEAFADIPKEKDILEEIPADAKAEDALPLTEKKAEDDLPSTEKKTEEKIEERIEDRSDTDGAETASTEPAPSTEPEPSAAEIPKEEEPLEETSVRKEIPQGTRKGHGLRNGIIVIVIIAAIIAALALTTYFAPSSAVGRFFHAEPKTPQAMKTDITKPQTDLTGVIQDQIANDREERIGEIAYDPTLKYDKDQAYEDQGVQKSRALQINTYKRSGGATGYLDEDITGAVIKYAAGEVKAGKTVKSLKIGELRKGEKAYYAWVSIDGKKQVLKINAQKDGMTVSGPVKKAPKTDKTQNAAANKAGKQGASAAGSNQKTQQSQPQKP